MEKKKKVTPLPFWHKSDLYPPDVFSLSVWCIFNCAAVFPLPLFIVSNSQRGFAVGEGRECAGMMKEVLFISSDSLGFVWKHQTFFFIYIYKFPLYLNELAYSSFPHFPYMGYCKDCMMVICGGSCAARSCARLLFKQRLMNW